MEILRPVIRRMLHPQMKRMAMRMLPISLVILVMEAQARKTLIHQRILEALTNPAIQVPLINQTIQALLTSRIAPIILTNQTAQMAPAVLIPRARIQALISLTNQLLLEAQINQTALKARINLIVQINQAARTSPANRTIRAAALIQRIHRHVPTYPLLLVRLLDRWRMPFCRINL